MTDDSKPENYPTYEYYWEYITPKIIEHLRKGGVSCLKLNPDLFRKVEDRDALSFYFKYMNGMLCIDSIVNPIARKLTCLLEKEDIFFEYLKGRVLIIEISAVRFKLPDIQLVRVLNIN